MPLESKALWRYTLHWLSFNLPQYSSVPGSTLAASPSVDKFGNDMWPLRALSSHCKVHPLSFPVVSVDSLLVLFMDWRGGFWHTASLFSRMRRYVSVVVRLDTHFTAILSWFDSYGHQPPISSMFHRLGLGIAEKLHRGAPGPLELPVRKTLRAHDSLARGSWGPEPSEGEGFFSRRFVVGR